MKIWDNYLQKNPQDAKRNIVSLVFEDGEDTYTEECLFTVTERKKPIRVTEYVFKSASLSKQDVKMIIGSLQQMMTTNKFNEPTGKGERFDRISVNPDYMNIETTADRRAIPAGGHGMDYSIEESKTNKNMKKNVVKINENTLRQIVAESVKKVLKESCWYGDEKPFQTIISAANEIVDKFDYTQDDNYDDIGDCDGPDITPQIYKWAKNVAEGAEYWLRYNSRYTPINGGEDW